MATRPMTPIVKWAGGKTQLLEQIIARMPKDYNRYFEPFIGGAAVLFAVSPQQAFINDINEQLINVYKQMKENAAEVISLVNALDSTPCDEPLYMQNRVRYNEKIAAQSLDVECAALMIWLNKHCFNGLYRVNKKGFFNVPYNNKVNGKSIDESNITAIAEYLQAADISIHCSDFEELCAEVREGDFVYFDSPYVPESETANFTNYAKGGFSLEDHKRLAALFRSLDARGAKLMLSNNDVPLVHELYDGYKIESLDVKRMINRKADKRTGREVLITNY